MSILKKYSAIKWQIAQLTKEAKELEMEATEELEEMYQADTKPDYEFGTPYFTKRTRWEFSGKVKEEEKRIQEKVRVFEKPLLAKLEELQTKEVKEGIAKQIETKSLSFRTKSQ